MFSDYINDKVFPGCYCDIIQNNLETSKLKEKMDTPVSYVSCTATVKQCVLLTKSYIEEWKIWLKKRKKGKSV